MWLFMIICYVLSFLSFILLNIAFFQSFLRFSVFQANYVVFTIFTSIVYLLTETLIIFFFIGTGMGVKDLALENKIYVPFHERTRALKKKIFSATCSNILFMMTLFILVGAVNTSRMPAWAYCLLFFVCLLHYVKTKIVQNQSFKENSQIFIDISDVEASKLKKKKLIVNIR